MYALHLLRPHAIAAAKYNRNEQQLQYKMQQTTSAKKSRCKHSAISPAAKPCRCGQLPAPGEALPDAHGSWATLAGTSGGL